MKKKLVLTGIISLLLVFGMAVMSCGNKDDDNPGIIPGGGGGDLFGGYMGRHRYY
jgi:hypothetical protein